MGKIYIKESIEINASASKAWEIIGPNFLNIGDWGRGVNKSWRNDNIPISFKGAPAGGRFCDLGKFGIAEERIEHYDAEKKEIAWSATIDKMPGFLKNLQNNLTVDALSGDTCRITSNITGELKGIGGFFMGGLLKKNFAKQLRGFVKDWKEYAESGQVSQAKKRELSRLAK